MSADEIQYIYYGQEDTSIRQRMFLFFSGFLFLHDLIYWNEYRKTRMNLCQLTKFSIYVMVKRIFLFFSGCFYSLADVSVLQRIFLFTRFDLLKRVYRKTRMNLCQLTKFSIYIMVKRMFLFFSGCFCSLADFSFYTI